MNRLVLFAAVCGGALAATGAQAVTVLDTSLPLVNATNGSGTAVTTVTPGVGVTTTTTGPGGSGNRVSATFAPLQWQQRNVGAGGTVGITTNYARSGNGSAYFAGVDGNSKADLEYYFTSGLSLATVTASYDWLRDGGSTNNNLQQAAFRFFVDQDGNLGTSTDRGYMVYEWTYNNPGPAPTDTWVTANIDASAFLWTTGGLLDAFNVFNRDLSGWRALMPNATVLGLSVGTGSGWNGVYEGAVDNVSYRVGSGPATTFNFEVTEVSEPAALALFGIGLAGLIGLRRRRG
jgi:hypothetical protein